MPEFLYAFCAWLLRLTLSLRYRIELKNIEELYKEGYDQKGGILFLPNHPAEIDPIILNAILGHPFRPRPLVVEHFYNMPGAHFFMKLVKALPVPNFDVSSNTWMIRQVEKCLNQVKERLQYGDNFLIYPSGHLQRDGKEAIGGNSFVHRVLEICPDAKVVLVRTTGLWGSLFSCAITGSSPDFWQVLKKGLKIIFKNGIFFCPRRKITIEFAIPSKDFPYKGSRLEQNQYLESWYNKYKDETGKLTDQEPLRLVSFSPFSKEFPQIAKKEKEKPIKRAAPASKEVQKVVFTELARMTNRRANAIDPSMDLSRDLGLDSLDLAGVRAFLDEHYDIRSFEPQQISTVEDLLELIAQGKEKRGDQKPVEKGAIFEWPKEEFRKEPCYPKGATVQEVFLNACDRMGKTAACGDDLSKIVSYQKLKLGVMVLAKKFEAFNDRYIGVLLPSSVGAYMVILAILMARKVPVVLNWTAGARSLNFAKQLLDLHVVISARRFLERADSLDLGDLEDNLVLMEELRKKISFWDKLTGVLLAHKDAEGVIKKFHLQRIEENEPAVVLFTSGTETYPKAVPLSHHNLIENQKGAFELVKVNREDILYGVLPPFHSFGFSVAGLLPLLVGLRVFFSPDPTDSQKMARDSEQRKITLLCCAPSFYRNLFRVASPQQLKTVRMFVSGAEKAPKELFEAVAKLGKDKPLIEGYGITECSPIVTLSPQGSPPRGVGKPIPGVELCIIDAETEKKINPEEEGEICIKGPNVFSGYLGVDVPNPFIEIDGEKWYRSGDRGKIDHEGYLILGGRLKRFVKIGGEMVSLASLEEELTKFAKEKGWVDKEEERPQLAVGANEKEADKPELVLFATFSVPAQEINAALRELGFARIVKVREVRQIPEIPITGTGKVQFRKINEMIKENEETKDT